jgi:[ribosomal protein S5]-alanine N-acetyltransferase
MKNNIKTERLLLTPLCVDDAKFMQVLTNTEGWLANIGDRNTKDEAGALAYVNKILARENAPHWVVNLSDKKVPIGIVSFMKKEHLENSDIGFAFLPNYMGNGYAYEASHALLLMIAKAGKHQSVIGETLASNKKSILLLEKLGLQFEKEIDDDGEKMQVYKTELANILNAQKMLDLLKPKKSADPLHGKTLEKILIELQEKIGWAGMEEMIPINCFRDKPSIKSSLTFLRKTPWARKRVEDLWVFEIGIR